VSRWKAVECKDRFNKWVGTDAMKINKNRRGAFYKIRMRKESK
jgi:hypothetical protein